jgi:predicted phage terminase large subunit-like protein
MFRSSHFAVVDAAPADVSIRVRAWDLAATRQLGTGDPDYSVGARISRGRDGVCYIEHIERFRADPAEVERAIVNTATADGVRTQVALWEDPGGAGKAMANHYTRVLMGYVVTTKKAAKDKVTYASPWAAQAQAGNIRLVAGPWVTQFLAEAEAFPEGRHDDQVDAVSLAFQIFADSNLDMLRGLAKWR